MEITNPNLPEAQNQLETGTLAIDLGNSTTVVAFQGELTSEIKLLDLTPISRIPGEIPTLVWCCPEKAPYKLIGNEVTQLESLKNDDENISSDFKRWICAPKQETNNASLLSPEKAGEILIQKIWENLPKNLIIKRIYSQQI